MRFRVKIIQDKAEKAREDLSRVAGEIRMKTLIAVALLTLGFLSLSSFASALNYECTLTLHHALYDSGKCTEMYCAIEEEMLPVATSMTQDFSFPAFGRDDMVYQTSWSAAADHGKVKAKLIIPGAEISSEDHEIQAPMNLSVEGPEPFKSGDVIGARLHCDMIE
jgi:hypothetical protein